MELLKNGAKVTLTDINGLLQFVCTLSVYKSLYLRLDSFAHCHS